MRPCDVSDTGAPSKGGRVYLSSQEAEIVNLRALETSWRKGKPFFVPSEQPLELLFFRFIFKHMREELPPELSVLEDNNIPIQDFQRTLERLFYVLGDARGFDATAYDLDGNGCVGWGEFCVVFKERSIVIRLTPIERVYLTLDDPDSSRLAHMISSFVLMVIATSSTSFILSTHPEFRSLPLNGEPPKAYGAFKIIENVCLAIFVVEYVLRLCTCWLVRGEIADRAKLLAITTSNEVIRLPSALERLVKFFFAPANIIDLAAILPGVVSLFYQINGGGFVVLRLIRLTRILRAKPLRGPTTAIVRAIQQSTNALYVLLFNLGLGVVISGSLMYLAEAGEWHEETHTYRRVVGREWSNDLDRFVNKYDESVWPSIPHAFWWAMVTATTVGYGDQYPTTAWGYVIATVAMVFFLVIAALPIGVIGSNFSKSYEELQIESIESAEVERTEVRKINEGIQRLDAFQMSNLMLVDVWNDRIPQLTGRAWEGSDNVGSCMYSLPLKAEFLGRVKIELPLDFDGPFSQEVTLPLKEDHVMIKRSVSGSITIRCEWNPCETTQDDDTLHCGGRPRCNSGHSEESLSPHRALMGKLKVTVVGADGLANINRSRPNSVSNPYCLVYCYTGPPSQIGEVVEPVVWRSPTVVNDLCPRWNASYEFNYHWPESGGQVADPTPSHPDSEKVIRPPMTSNEDLEVVAPPGHIAAPPGAVVG